MKRLTQFDFEIYSMKKKKKVNWIALAAVGIALGWLYLLLDTMFLVYQYNSLN